MQISERLNFNGLLMEFCLRTIQWSPKKPEEEQLNNFTSCLSRTVIAEQLFRAELTRERPGMPPQEEEDE
jgi:hypothetical protein